MAGRLARSIDLFRASWGVLRDDKRLLVFPVVSVLAGVVILTVFALPVFGIFMEETVTIDAWGRETSDYSLHPLGWVVVAIGYLAAMYVGTFMNAGLVVAANERLTGTGPGTVSSGLRGAAAKAGPIGAWVLLAATVGFVLRMLEERLGFIGRIVIGLVGLAWSLLTFLVVPVLVLEEGHTVGTAVSRTTRLFKETWGENVIGNVGFGLVTAGLILAAFTIVIVGLVSGSTMLLVVTLLAAVVLVLVGSQVIAAMNGIYRVALYRYAVDGEAPPAYAAFDFSGAFRSKGGTGLFSKRSDQSLFPAVGTPMTSESQRRAWQPWEPPAEEPIHGEAGIEIPGVDSLPRRQPPTPGPRQGSGTEGWDDGWGSRPGSDWPTG